MWLGLSAYIKNIKDEMQNLTPLSLSVSIFKNQVLLLQVETSADTDLALNPSAV